MGDGLTDLWDAKLNAWVLHWDWRQTLSHPLDLFQAPFFHPARYVLAFSENLFGVALFGFPLLSAGASPLLNYNVLLLAGMFLSALSAWALARYVTGDAASSAAAGIVYAFLPWRFSQIPHLQHQWGAFLCLLLLFLLRYLDAGARRDQVLFALFFAWNALANVHYALFSGFVVGLALFLHAAQAPPGPERARRLRGALLASAAGALAFVPFAIAYRRAAELYGMRRYFSEVLTFSGRWQDFLSAGEKNRLYGSLTERWRHPEGDFFPGLCAVALAVYAVVRVARPSGEPAAAASVPPARRRTARLLDATAAVTAAAWIGALVHPGLRLGPVGLGDAGRVQVILTLLVLVRLAVAFPATGRYASLGDWLRRGPLPAPLALFVGLALVGVGLALGGHTPYYRFLFGAFGGIFRAIRVPSRGIVLFDLALAVLAAWGLSILARERSAAGRRISVAAALLAIGIEYRAFPLPMHPYAERPPAVYAWIRDLSLAGAVVEWPLGSPDVEYLYRQTAHGKPLVNGYSGFFPESYLRLQRVLRERPIPDAIWGELAGAGTGLVVYHPWIRDPSVRMLDYARLVRRGLADKRLEILGSFPAEGGRDIVLRPTTAPPLAAGFPAGAAAEAARLLDESDAAIEPPFGAIDGPAEGAEVAPGSLVFGWALDDSGLEAVRVATELGPAGDAALGLPRRDVAKAYPDYDTPGGAGFSFPVPPLPPGPHRIVVTLVGRDGGHTDIERRIRVR